MPDSPFKFLPLTIRVLAFTTAPVLLSPVVLNLYGAYYAVTNYNEDVIDQIRAVISSLNVAEVILESVPQLITQWAAQGLLLDKIQFRHSTFVSGQ